MPIIYLALKDIYQIVRNKKAALFLLLMPVAFTCLLGFIFSQNQNSDPRLPVGVLDQDGGLLAPHLLALLGASSSVRPVIVTSEDGLDEQVRTQVRTQKLAAVVIVPPDFSRRTLDGDPATLTVLVDAATPTGQAADRAIQLVTTRLLGAVQAARISADAHGPFEQAGREAFVAAGIALAIEDWQTPRLQIDVRQAGSAAQSTVGLPYNGFAQASTGMLVFFTAMSVIHAGYVLLAERRSRTLERLWTTPLRRAEVIAGHVLAMFVVSFVQVLLLATFGQLALNVNYWQAPGALLILSAALALWTACLGLLIGVIARSENQVSLLGLGSALVLGLMGGTFFPLDLAGKTFAAVGRMLPSAWAIDGLQNITLRGLGLQAALLPAGEITLAAILVFGIAVRGFTLQTTLPARWHAPGARKASPGGQA